MRSDALFLSSVSLHILVVWTDGESVAMQVYTTYIALMYYFCPRLITYVLTQVIVMVMICCQPFTIVKQVTKLRVVAAWNAKIRTTSDCFWRDKSFKRWGYCKGAMCEAKQPTFIGRPVNPWVNRFKSQLSSRPPKDEGFTFYNRFRYSSVSSCARSSLGPWFVQEDYWDYSSRSTDCLSVPVETVCIS